MANKKIEISLENCSIKILVLDSANPNAPEYYLVSALKSIIPLFDAGIGVRTNLIKKTTYPYDDRKQIVMNFHDENGSSSFTFDLESVDNQAGWTLNLAGLLQAQLDITGWIASCTAAGAAIGLATEATLQILTAAIGRSLASATYAGAGAQATNAGVKAATIYCLTGKESINGIVRPVGSYVYETSRGEDTINAISMNPNAGGIIIVDELS